MHIGFDGMIWGGQETGVAAATRRLFLCLAAADPCHALTAFVPRDTSWPGLCEAGRNHVQLIRRPRAGRARRVLWQQFALPSLARRHRLDVLYCPCYTVPLRCCVPTIVTVHDTIVWNRPDVCRRLNVAHFRSLVAASVRRARCVTVPTETVKRDLLNITDIPADRVHVIPWGVDFELCPMAREEARALVQERFNVGSPFVLFAGCQEPKKNLAVLMEATRRLGVLLVMAGPRGWGSTLARHIWAAQREGHCRHLGYVSPSELSALYSAAGAFAFPSHIEGFGLPVVEAMAHGTPVVASDAPALREVCGGAALHVPAGDLSALAAALRSALADDAVRARMIGEGRARARHFTWDRTTRLFLDLLQRMGVSERSE